MSTTATATAAKRAKIHGRDYQALKQAIAKMDTDAVNQRQPGYCATAALYRDYGRTPQRFRWDWMRAALRHTGQTLGHAHNGDAIPVYDYANDDHLDTALRAIARELAGADHWSAQK